MFNSDLSNMMVTVDRNDTLKILKENRERHSKIVQEARDGYIKSAKRALASRMEELEKGELVALSFNLVLPQDYTSTYDVAIKMLEMHTQETLEIDGLQVSHLVMDDWDWQHTFLNSNAGFSDTAKVYAITKNFSNLKEFNNG